MTVQDNQYVTRDELVARMAELELRIAERIIALETRMHAEFRSQFRWMLGLILPIYALLIAGLIFLYNAKPGG